jgi:hypothetical protein
MTTKASGNNKAQLINSLNPNCLSMIFIIIVRFYKNKQRMRIFKNKNLKDLFGEGLILHSMNFTLSQSFMFERRIEQQQFFIKSRLIL